MFYFIVIFIDIEGIISSILFVKNVLFLYVCKVLLVFVVVYGQQLEVCCWLDVVVVEIGGVCQDSLIVEILQGWIDQDCKYIVLKVLQGMIWESGYCNGDYKVYFYFDVVVVLKGWYVEGKLLYVYLFGLVLVQKQFFGFSEVGDLIGLVLGWFDIEVGGKCEVDSYCIIVKVIGVFVVQIVFLFDVVEELDVVCEVGLQICLFDWLDDYLMLCSGEVIYGYECVENFQQIVF